MQNDALNPYEAPQKVTKQNCNRKLGVFFLCASRMLMLGAFGYIILSVAVLACDLMDKSGWFPYIGAYVGWRPRVIIVAMFSLSELFPTRDNWRKGLSRRLLISLLTVLVSCFVGMIIGDVIYDVKPRNSYEDPPRPPQILGIQATIIFLGVVVVRLILERWPSESRVRRN